MTPIPDHEVILAIDPGNIESAYCLLQGKHIGEFGKVPNERLLALLKPPGPVFRHIACEMITSYGMPAGASLFDTCVFIGRIIAAAPASFTGAKVTLLGRMQVKAHICHSGRATDANIRQALLDQFGPPGTKKFPGPTYGISADVWSALAIAETFRSGDFTPYTLGGFPVE